MELDALLSRVSKAQDSQPDSPPDSQSIQTIQPIQSISQQPIQSISQQPIQPIHSETDEEENNSDDSPEDDIQFQEEEQLYWDRKSQRNVAKDRPQTLQDFEKELTRNLLKSLDEIDASTSTRPSPSRSALDRPQTLQDFENELLKSLDEIEASTSTRPQSSHSPSRSEIGALENMKVMLSPGGKRREEDDRTGGTRSGLRSGCRRSGYRKPRSWEYLNAMEASELGQTTVVEVEHQHLPAQMVNDFGKTCRKVSFNFK